MSMDTETEMTVFSVSGSKQGTKREKVSRIVISQENNLKFTKAVGEVASKQVTQEKDSSTSKEVQNIIDKPKRLPPTVMHKNYSSHSADFDIGKQACSFLTYTYSNSDSWLLNQTK